jgi:predicted type IV restriction endonuclease
MSAKSEAAHDVRRVLHSVKAFLATPSPYALSDAATRARFTEPLLRALGYHSVGDVRHDVAIPNATQCLDYVLLIDGEPRVGIASKALGAWAADADGAQVVQHCTLLGIEWAVLTNMRAWRLYNAALNGPLSAKLILSADLVTWESIAQYDAVFAKLWLISKDAFHQVGGPESWLSAHVEDDLVATFGGVSMRRRWSLRRRPRA